MPHKDPEARRKYEREWHARKYRQDPEFRERMKAEKKRHEATCEECGAQFLGRKNARFCSRNCSVKWMWKNGKANQFVKGGKPSNAFAKGYRPWNYKGRTLNSRGYVQIFLPGHEMADKKGYVLEHRLVMAESLGRALTATEAVHHRNGVKHDNRLENLKLVGRAYHDGEVTCPHCQATFHIL
jgi:hypothetical protein